MQTFGNWVRTREGVSLLPAKLQTILATDYRVPSVQSILGSGNKEVKRRGYTPSKQDNYVTFFKLVYEQAKGIIAYFCFLRMT